MVSFQGCFCETVRVVWLCLYCFSNYSMVKNNTIQSSNTLDSRVH